MPARTKCRACGGTIVITEDESDEDILAIGDQFFHRGCVEAAPRPHGPTGPVYLIPRDW